MNLMTLLVDGLLHDSRAFDVLHLLTCQLDHLVPIFAAQVGDSALANCCMLLQLRVFLPRNLPKIFSYKGIQIIWYSPKTTTSYDLIIAAPPQTIPPIVKLSLICTPYQYFIVKNFLRRNDVILLSYQ